MDSGEKVIVGLNKFTIPEEEEFEEQDIFEADPGVETLQKEKLTKVKAERNGEDVKLALSKLEKAIDSTENLMPCIIEAVKHYVSLGEICQVMRDKWGEFKPTTYV